METTQISIPGLELPNGDIFIGMSGNDRRLFSILSDGEVFNFGPTKIEDQYGSKVLIEMQNWI